MKTAQNLQNIKETLVEALPEKLKPRCRQRGIKNR